MAKEFYALFYKTVDNYVELRKQFRDQHLALATVWTDEKKLILGGAFEPADEAMLIFHVENKFEVESFVDQDPYVLQGLITSWTIRKWNVAVKATD